jgi:rSAM/selenodomain-associated transferase 2
VVTLRAEKGRARQMNTGAARSTGEILLFLHADTLLPANALAKIEEALSDEICVGGAFDLGIQNSRRIFQIIGWCASWKHRLTRVPYGDQAIFLRRKYFEELGGYPEIPLMEDVELMKRIKRKGRRIIILPDAVKTSSRKWEKDGVIYTIFRNWALQTLYLMGMPAARLVKYYYKECQEQ